jgi:hypothetical protein
MNVILAWCKGGIVSAGENRSAWRKPVVVQFYLPHWLAQIQTRSLVVLHVSLTKLFVLIVRRLESVLGDSAIFPFLSLFSTLVTAIVNNMALNIEFLKLNVSPVCMLYRSRSKMEY